MPWYGNPEASTPKSGKRSSTIALATISTHAATTFSWIFGLSQPSPNAYGRPHLIAGVLTMAAATAETPL